MENGLPALMIAAILMLSTVLMARGGFLGADAIGQSLRTSEASYGQQNRTALTVTNTSVDPTGANITITILNNGQTPVANFASMDVVLQYFDVNNARHDIWIPYTSGALAANTWTTGAFTNDLFEPGILNNGVSVQILIRVNPVVAPASTNLAVIGTDMGVTVRTQFAGP
jgi:archaellum component FlaF (FlaF/FlaG flagellin family)